VVNASWLDYEAKPHCFFLSCSVSVHRSDVDGVLSGDVAHGSEGSQRFFEVVNLETYK